MKDSEHNAIFSPCRPISRTACRFAGAENFADRFGGPFRTVALDELSHVTPIRFVLTRTG